MQRNFIVAVCRSCPFSLLAGGGDGGTWRVEQCQFPRSEAPQEKRRNMPLVNLAGLAECPHPVRGAQANGQI